MPTNAFMRKGITKIFWVPTIAVKASPTVAEISAGTALTPEIAEVNGFEFVNQLIETPDMANTFTGKITGADSIDDSSITFYQRQTGTDTVKAALAKGNVGHIVIFDRGTAGASVAAADKAEVWPAVVASNSNQYTADNEAAKFVVMFACTDPKVDATVAA